MPILVVYQFSILGRGQDQEALRFGVKTAELGIVLFLINLFRSIN